MAEIARLSGCSEWITLEFVERTPNELMELGIRLHLSGLSLSNTISELEKFGVDPSRTTVHNWVQKADRQPTNGKPPNHLMIDETVIRLNDQRFWLYAAADPETNEFLHVKHYPTRTIVVTKRFLQEVHKKHRIADTVFLVDGASWLQATSFS